MLDPNLVVRVEPFTTDSFQRRFEARTDMCPFAGYGDTPRLAIDDLLDKLEYWIPARLQ